MANNQRFTLTFDANLDVTQIKGALNQIQTNLNTLRLPQNIAKGLQGSFDNLKKEVQNFEAIMNKDITGKTDFNKLENQANKVATAYEKLKIQVKNLTSLSSRDIEKLFPETVSKNINQATTALKNYQANMAKAKQSVADAATQVAKFQQKIQEVSNKTPLTNDEWKQLKTDIANAEQEVVKYKTAIQDAQQRAAAVEARTPNYKKSSTWREAQQDIQKYTTALQGAEQEVQRLNSVQQNSITYTKQNQQLTELNTKLADAKNNYVQLEQALKLLESTGNGGGLKALLDEIGRITGLDMSKFKSDLTGVGDALQTYFTQAANNAATGVNNLANATKGAAQPMANLGAKVRDTGAQISTMDSQIRDIQALKARIQYFFGLNNAINLVKRAIRGAFNTIKDLDKAMTETAVVTDFSVSDMWAQLPEYTKRANELGVTTQAAYEAATLYYQQGLKTNEVNALSVETLKMARIAGLDAAEATDRMTNALRGFNMELTTANAQRVDDVYSELAANTASNVDEISTAMTKVASLAHNANMEFETTAAFLAQIIETTRESAETAGTALKTVVARFSEVKKLVDEGTLRGQDEEGQIIDVNKVSAALRTAGIDMNKYFLGEVGLDDIFIELASKWDSLTALQQRYIATQAAGSRQQSRFIALMSDYARTQELVGKAYKANGAAARQFEKTQDSLESKLARLKNAWNEFLMGLSNNVIVKGAVDFLTDLLNVINKLTSAFGEGASSILKWATAFLAFKGIKGLLSVNSPLLKGLSALTYGTVIGNIGQKIGLFGAGAANGAAGAVGTGSLGLGALLGNAGKGIWGGAKNLGTFMTGAGTIMGGGFGKWGAGASLTGSAGMAAGLTGIATAIGAIAVAIGAGVAAYQLWLHLTPEGKLKKATKEAEKLKETAKQAEDDLNSLKSLESTYQEKNEQVTNATTAEDKQKAILERNEAILEAIKADGTLTEYVVTEKIDDQIVLTLNEQKLADAASKAAEIAAQAAIDAYFGAAKEAFAQGEVYEKQLQAMAQSISTPEQIYMGSSSNEALQFILNSNYYSDTQKNKALELVDLITKSQGTAGTNAGLAYAETLKGLNVSDELANLLIPALSEATKSANDFFTETELKSFVDSLSGPTGEAYAKALSLYLDKVDFSKANLTLSNINLDELLGDLDLTGLEKITGKTSEQLKTIIQQNIQSQREQQKKVNTDTANRAIQVGRNLGWEDSNIASTIANIYAMSSFEEQKAINDLLNSITNDQIAGIVLQNLDNSGLREWVAELDFSKPIETLLELQKTAKETKEGPIHDLAVSLQKDVQFSSSSLLESFTTSADYDSLTESLDKFLEENGKITSSNILELADSNKTLNDLLKTGAISAKALAVALNGIETGKIQVWDLNDAIIAALNSMDDLDSITKRTIDDLNSFDPGYDENDVVSFINKVIENVTSNIEKGAWGNNQMRNYMEYIFGSFGGAPGEEYENWLTSNLAWLEANKENMKSAWSDIASESKEAAIASGDAIPIWEENGEIIIEIEKETTNDLIKYLQEQKGLTEQQARMMIADYKNYSSDFALTLEQNDLENVVATWAEKAGEKGWYLDKDLQTLAKALGVDVEEINNILAKLNPNLKEIKYGEGTVQDIERILAQTGNSNYKTSRAEAWNIPEQVLKSQGNASLAYFNEKLINFNELKQSMMDADLGGQFESTINQMAQAGDTFLADFGRGLEEVKVNAGENAIDAYARAAEESANKALATAIGEAVVTALSEEHDIKIGADTDSATEKVNTLFALVNEQVNQNYSTSIQIDTSAATTNIKTLASAYRDLAGAINEVSNAGRGGGSGSSGGKSTGTSVYTRAKGGIVSSYGSGSYRVEPGPALTGEEGPEIVWNKDKGYAYVTGQGHPEIRDLQPGDRIFNAQETRKILGSVAKGGVINSYADRVHGYGDTKEKIIGTSEDTDDYKKQSTWRNELDWLYDLMEDIAEEERKQTEIQAKYELATKDLAKTGKDLFNLTKQELASLTTQLDAQNTAYLKRLQQMGELQTIVNSKGFQDYLQWNQKDKTLEIDWDKIEAIQDKDTYEELTDLISRMEEVQDQMDDAQKSILDIKKQINELQNRYLQQYLDFQKRVLDAVVKQYQDAIDSLSELNSTLDATNKSILDSIQKEIDLERQIRDNTETEQNIADMEARLAYLQRDTSGANDEEIRQLQKQLEDARQSYSDSLVDQALNRLAESNDEASEQRNKQIELMQAQLDYWQEGGGLWGEVADLIAEGFTGDGSIIQSSNLWELLKDADAWDSMSEAQKKNWANELILSTNEVGAHLVQLSGGIEVNADLVRSSIAETNGILTNTISVELERVRAILAEMGSLGGTPEHSYTSDKTEGDGGYATGGLNTRPGKAMLHGTANEPEYVLNARQTDAFLRLAEVLPAAMSGNVNTSSVSYGNSMFDININVESISNDYDVDKLVARLKDNLADIAGYRNVNALSFIR